MNIDQACQCPHSYNSPTRLRLQYSDVPSLRFPFRLSVLLFRSMDLTLARLVTFLLLDHLVLGPRSPLQQVPISDPCRRKIRRSFATNIRRVEHGFFSDSPERQ